MARDKTSGNRLRNFCRRAARDGNCTQAEFAPSSELPVVWPVVAILCILPATTDRAKFLADEPTRVVNQPPLAGEYHRRSHFRGAPLAQSRARTADLHRRHGYGVDVRARAEHLAARGGTSSAGLARIVGIPHRMAPHAPRRPRILFAVLALTIVPQMSASRAACLHREKYFRLLPVRFAGNGLLIFCPKPCGDSFLNIGESFFFVLPLGHASGQGGAFDNDPAIFRLVERHMKEHADILPIAAGCYHAGGFAVICRRSAVSKKQEAGQPVRFRLAENRSQQFQPRGEWPAVFPPPCRSHDVGS
jgi:hypothetical protein